jgi:hypothetical protein
MAVKFVPRAEQVGSLKRPRRLIAANEAIYAPGHVAVEQAERAHGMHELYAIAAEESRACVQRQSTSASMWSRTVSSDGTCS